MGLGDWLMATAQAKEVNIRTGRRVTFANPGGRVFWHPEVFANNPRISQSTSGAVEVIVNCPGHRPYIAEKTLAAWKWQRWPIMPGEIWLTDAEREAASWAQGMMVIEPHTKVPGGNKAWAFDRWQAVVDRRDGIEFIQVHRPGAKILRGVTAVMTTFREACALLSRSRGFVGTEGALHHAAAALGVPAVVLWSEFISPEFTGYESQVNIRHAGDPCGSRLPCAGCRASMDAISVDEVTEAIRSLQ